MKNWSMIVALAVILTMGMACAPKTPGNSENQTTSTETATSSQTVAPKTVADPPPITRSGVTLHPNPVATTKPIYGGTLIQAGFFPTTFDDHQQVSYGPTVVLPVFNQLVQFDINYKDTVPETLIGDLADSWETSADGTEITFHLHQGVKWHDGVAFTADDVVYSLDKMADFTRSAISGTFPAYQSTEKLDDYTVKVHLKYPSAGFMISLAAGEATIEAKHLAGTNGQTAAFMIGTGPFMLTKYIPGVELDYKRNPDYFKKDSAGNQLPYMDGIIYYYQDNALNNDSLIARRLDLKNTTTGAATVDTIKAMEDGAPDLLWQKRTKDNSAVMFLNLGKPPLNDIRVRQAMGLVESEADLIVGYAGDVSLGIPDSGILPPSFGLPKSEIDKLMGWDKPMADRIAKAKQLMTEAGFPNGFKLNMIAQGGSVTEGGSALVFAAALKTYLNIDSEVHTGISTSELENRLQNDNYDVYVVGMRVGEDPISLNTYFSTDGYGNFSHYANSKLDDMLGQLDRIVDPVQRRQAIWDIETTLLTDLPALPTGCFIANYMPYYPWVKNIRWTNMSYSDTNRLEDVWIDPSLKPK